MRTPLLCCVLLASAGLAAPVPKPAKPADLKALEGRWGVVTIDRGSGPHPQINDSSTFWVEVNDGNLSSGTATLKGHVERPITLDPSKSPKHLDLELKNGKVLPCVYELDGDTLTWCETNSPDDRPPELKGGETQVCYVLKRVKGEKKDK